MVQSRRICNDILSRLPYPNLSIPCLEEDCLVDTANILMQEESQITIYLTDSNGEDVTYGSVLLYNELYTVGRGNGIENGKVILTNCMMGSTI